MTVSLQWIRKSVNPEPIGRGRITGKYHRFLFDGPWIAEVWTQKGSSGQRKRCSPPDSVSGKWEKPFPRQDQQDCSPSASFADFAPTVLNLLGLPTPTHMQGIPFPWSSIEPSETASSGIDRVDEVRDLARSVRGKDFLFTYAIGAVYLVPQPTHCSPPIGGKSGHEFYRLAEQNDPPEQWHFAGSHCPAEELYDCRNDPQTFIT